MKKIGVATLAVMIFVLGAWSGVFLDQRRAPAATVEVGSTEFRLVTQAWNITQQVYVDRTAATPQNMTYGAIGGMIDALGDTGHSRFLTPDQLKQEQNFQLGQFEGIGIEVQEKDGHVLIVAPFEGSPAQKAGLRSGEVILDVDGKPVVNLADAVHRILGPAGTTVTLTIASPTGTTRDVTITRARINVPIISWHMLPGTTFAHVRISSFSQGVSADLAKALLAAKEQGATGYVLDLRDNPGGLLDESVNTASVFLKSGNVLLEKDVTGKTVPVPVVSDKFVTDAPMVVLISQGTASAAEIVAGALQDNNRAKIVGVTTFGTGTVLENFSLADGSALLLATQEWLTPSGKTIWHTGLVPDVTVTLAADAVVVYPGDEDGMTADQLSKSSDSQLLKALSMLNGQ
ncbi:MAG: S41 family peptidase [Dehalococcoidia bacterium]|nr:S41 family peptidase [Dehalococcoidia bacterium]